MIKNETIHSKYRMLQALHLSGATLTAEERQFVLDYGRALLEIELSKPCNLEVFKRLKDR